MSLDNLTDDEYKVIMDAFETLRTVEEHYVLRDRANAKIHMARVRLSPLTRAVIRATKNLSAILNEQDLASVTHASESNTGSHPGEIATTL